LSSYEFLAMLEGKIGEAPFFRVQSGKIPVCQYSLIQGVLAFLLFFFGFCSQKITLMK
jgi:hypothetical protein